MNNEQTFSVQLRDTCSYNSNAAQVEMVFKLNYPTDRSQKMLMDSLDQLKEMMEGGRPEPGEYYFPWIYVTRKNGVITGGHFHGYPNDEIQSTRLEPFLNWFTTGVKAWADKNGLTWMVDNPGIECKSLLTIQFTL